VPDRDQQFSVNDFYGKSGGIGKRWGFRKPSWGFTAFGLREPRRLQRVIWVHLGNAATWPATGSVGDLDGVGMGVRACEVLRGSNLSRVSDLAQKVFEVVKKQQPVGDAQIVPVLLPRAEAAAAVLVVQVA